MTIAQVSREYGLTADTLRYYERIGLLPRVNRNSSGNRDYTEEDCKWVNFIKCMRNAGVSIEILIEYVNTLPAGNDSISVRKELLLEQRKQIVEKIEELQETLSYLDYKINAYDECMMRIEDELKNSINK